VKLEVGERKRYLIVHKQDQNGTFCIEKQREKTGESWLNGSVESKALDWAGDSGMCSVWVIQRLKSHIFTDLAKSMGSFQNQRKNVQSLGFMSTVINTFFLLNMFSPIIKKAGLKQLSKQQKLTKISVGLSSFLASS
jgi:hypothetical protein